MRTTLVFFAMTACLVAACSDGDSPSVPAEDAAVAEDAAAQEDQAAEADPAEAAATDAAADQAVGWAGEHTYSGQQGSRRYLVHVPPSYSGAPMPLFMVLHGCTQTPEAIQVVTGFDALANQHGFVTVYPHQDSSANPYGCWNWFLPSHQGRDAGEPAILRAIASEVAANVAIDPKRVHVAGLSAGGAMAVVLAATWPDVFASAAAVAGCPYKGTPCLNAASTESAATLASWVHEAMASRARLMPMLFMQGSNDSTVPPANAELLLAQWLGANDLADDGQANGSVSAAAAKLETGTSPGGLAYTVETYEHQSAALMELWKIEGMDHAWPGGAAGKPFSEPKGPDATAQIQRFLAAHPMP
jgi:poly(hydroxyalkanoate) depolymerase family esterase